MRAFDLGASQPLTFAVAVNFEEGLFTTMTSTLRSFDFDLKSDVSRARVVRTYTLLGVAPAESRMFVAVVGLMRSKLRDDWVLVPTGDADVAFIGPDCDVASGARWRGRALLIGMGVDLPGLASFRLPMLPITVLEALEKASETLAQSSDVNRTNASRPQTRSELPGEVRHQGARYRLTRWPSNSHLHAQPKRVKIATCMMRRSLTIGELSAVSGVSAEICADFVDLLLAQRDGAIAFEADVPKINASPSAQSQGANRATPEKRSLFARIRSRLGI